MKKLLKIILIFVCIVIICVIIDLISIFNFNRPIFAIKGNSENVYIGLFYDTYNCFEYSAPQIKVKGTKFTCSVNKIEE